MTLKTTVCFPVHLIPIYGYCYTFIRTTLVNSGEVLPVPLDWNLNHM